MCCMPSSPLGSTHYRTTSGVTFHHFPWTTQRGMPYSPLVSIHGRTTSHVTCHNLPWNSHIVRRRREWYAIIALGQQTQTNDFGYGTPSLPLHYINGHKTSCMACPHCSWVEHMIGRRWAWHDKFPLESYTFGLRRALHSIIALRQNAQIDDVKYGM